MSVTVRVPGTKSRVKIENVPGSTAADVLQAAAAELGVNLDTSVVAAVVDGKAADMAAELPADVTRVDGAPKVRNGG